jgi:putative transposase
LEEGKPAKLAFKNSAAQPTPVPESWFVGLNEIERQEVFWEFPAAADRTFEQLDKGQQEKFKKIKKRIEEAVDLRNTDVLLMHKASMAAHIQKRAKADKVHRTTIARDIARFFVCGDFVKAAMLTVHAKRLQGEERVVKKKQGRPEKRIAVEHSTEPRYVDAAGNTAVLEAIGVFLKSSSLDAGMSDAALYRRWRHQFALRPVPMADGTIAYAAASNFNISEGTFRYQKNLASTAQARKLEKVGRKNFDLKHRALTGTAWDRFDYPGHCYIIDSTVLDLYLVCGADRKLLVGRPVVYIVIDAWSWTILAFHVAFAGPNLEEAKIALHRALRPKDDLLCALGKTHLLPFLPAGPMPLSIFADRAEMLSEGADKLSDTWGIRDTIAAPYRADWKALVERLFGIVNEVVVHWVPGAVRKRMKERGDRDVRHDAVLTKKGLERLLWSLAAEWNATKDMESHISTTMLREEIDATPLSFLNWGLHHLARDARYLSRGDAITQLLKAHSSRVDHRGFHILEQQLRFTADWMTEDAFYDIRENGSARLYLDPDYPLLGYVLTETADGVSLLRDVSFKGRGGYEAETDLCLEDIQVVEEWSFLTSSDGKNKLQHFRDVSEKERDEEIASETRETNAAKQHDGRSKAQRVKSIDSNRAASENAVRLAAGSVKGKAPAPSMTPHAEDAWLNALNDLMNPYRRSPTYLGIAKNADAYASVGNATCERNQMSNYL